MIQTQVGHPLQASKWIKLPMLLDPEEMVFLLEALGEFFVYFVGCVTPAGQGELARRTFLDLYYDYVCALREGREPDLAPCRAAFSSVFTVSQDTVYTVPVAGDKQLIRVAKPVVQLQAHTMGYSPVDGKFRSMVLGKDAINWGIQFSYPQLFQDPETSQIMSVDTTFPNTKLFRALQRWMRQQTLPTPLTVNGVTTNVPIRIGKQCLRWIDQHPQLNVQGIQVDAS